MDDLNTDDLPKIPSAETPDGKASDEAPELELDPDPEGAGDGQPEEEDDLEDWEDEGKTYKIPKALKPHLLRNKDYTQGKQAQAEARKADEAERAAFAEEQKFHREHNAAVADIRGFEKQIAAFRAVTPEQWAAMDPTKAGELRLRFDLLKDQRETAVNEVNQKWREALEKQRSSTAKQFEDSQARIAKEIPGWSDELAGKLNGYAMGKGYTEHQLRDMLLHPHDVGTLHKAYLYDQLVAKQRARASKPESPSAEPVPTLNARRAAPSAMPQASDSTDEWIRKERLRMEKKARFQA